MGWIGVDLDGTLAKYPHHEQSRDAIGEPIPLMVARVKGWLRAGKEVRIVTARVSQSQYYKVINEQVARIEDWCMVNLGKVLPVTSEKDFEMEVLWDDRCVQVIPNTGKPVTQQEEDSDE